MPDLASSADPVEPMPPRPMDRPGPLPGEQPQPHPDLPDLSKRKDDDEADEAIARQAGKVGGEPTRPMPPRPMDPPGPLPGGRPEQLPDLPDIPKPKSEIDQAEEAGDHLPLPPTIRDPGGDKRREPDRQGDRNHRTLSPGDRAAGTIWSGPGWHKGQVALQLLLSSAALAFGLTLSTIAGAQVISPPGKKDAGILINPTIAECNAGWTGNFKWSRPEFDQLCAVVNAPSSVVVNPTVEECNSGWDPSVRWTRQEFDAYCTKMRTAK